MGGEDEEEATGSEEVGLLGRKGVDYHGRGIPSKDPDCKTNRNHQQKENPLL